MIKPSSNTWPKKPLFAMLAAKAFLNLYSGQMEINGRNKIKNQVIDY